MIYVQLYHKQLLNCFRWHPKGVESKGRINKNNKTKLGSFYYNFYYEHWRFHLFCRDKSICISFVVFRRIPFEMKKYRFNLLFFSLHHYEWFWFVSVTFNCFLFSISTYCFHTKLFCWVFKIYFRFDVNLFINVNNIKMKKNNKLLEIVEFTVIFSLLNQNNPIELNKTKVLFKFLPIQNKCLPNIIAQKCDLIYVKLFLLFTFLILLSEIIRHQIIVLYLNQIISLFCAQFTIILEK